MDAHNLTQNLRGKWYGHYGAAPCPVCQPEARRDQNALTLRDGDGRRLLAHCKKSNCDFETILSAAGVSQRDYFSSPACPQASLKLSGTAEKKKVEQRARQCWNETKPIGGTPAEAYLRSRAITCDLPDSLRFHPTCLHFPTTSRRPAMVARIDGGEGFAIHRTYLGTDGRKAKVNPAKMMLGSVSGGAVRLSEGSGPLVVAEGIETALSLSCGLLKGPASIWAALSASGMAGLMLHSLPHRLTIAPDNDTAGINAAHKLAERADALGWAVDLLTPPEPGTDWNDYLKACGGCEQ